MFSQSNNKNISFTTLEVIVNENKNVNTSSSSELCEEKLCFNKGTPIIFHLKSTIDSVFFSPDLSELSKIITEIYKSQTFYISICYYINEIKLPKDLINIIHVFLSPINTINNITKCISNLRSDLSNLEQEDKFDLSWYDYTTPDYRWASNRLQSINNHKQQILEIEQNIFK